LVVVVGGECVDKRMVTILGYTIIIAWAISMIADAAVKTYDPPATVHGLMMILAGAAFTNTLRKGGDK
jgi:hypothetical protein